MRRAIQSLMLVRLITIFLTMQTYYLCQTAKCYVNVMLAHKQIQVHKSQSPGPRPPTSIVLSEPSILQDPFKSSCTPILTSLESLIPIAIFHLKQPTLNTRVIHPSQSQKTKNDSNNSFSDNHEWTFNKRQFSIPSSLNSKFYEFYSSTIS